uniref:glutathione transferase n=1 Tax=Eurytemora affinis TaxID=88015 RepID=A0A8B0MF13_EURAF|nr:GSTsigma3a [Eurytemora affinis]
MAEIKLTYFNTKGRAEISRLILAYAGVRYTDERVNNFPEIKASLPFGQLPVLTYKGTVIAQSLTMARFLANEYGLTGSSNLEAAQADEIVDSALDIMNAGIPLMRCKDEEEKKVLEKEYFAKVMEYFTRMENILVTRGGQFFVGNALTWADLMIFAYGDLLKDMNAAALNGFPVITDLLRRIAEIPNIKKWLETRPKSS